MVAVVDILENFLHQYRFTIFNQKHINEYYLNVDFGKISETSDCGSWNNENNMTKISTQPMTTAPVWHDIWLHRHFGGSVGNLFGRFCLILKEKKESYKENFAVF